MIFYDIKLDENQMKYIIRNRFLVDEMNSLIGSIVKDENNRWIETLSDIFGENY